VHAVHGPVWSAHEKWAVEDNVGDNTRVKARRRGGYVRARAAADPRSVTVLASWINILHSEVCTISLVGPLDLVLDGKKLSLRSLTPRHYLRCIASVPTRARSD
jgi:hypothetical protein